MNRRLVKNIFFPLDQRLKGFSILSALRELERTQWFTIEEMRVFQLQKLRNLIRHAYDNIPYYADLLNKLSLTPKDIINLEDLYKIPVLTKVISKDSYGKLQDYANRYRYQVRKTSGSTGIPKATLVDYNATAFHKAALLRGRRWWGIDNGDKHIVIWIEKKEITKAIKIRELITKNKVFLPVHLINKDNIDYIYKVFLKTKPDYIYGFSSAISQIVELLKSRGLTLSNKLKLKGVIYTSESILSNQLEMIQDYFLCPAINEYGCTEVFNIAFQCPEGNMHINSDNLIIEFINSEGNPCKEGEIGHILVTDLNNYKMPHIRYKIDDIGMFLNKRCSCGRGLSIIDLLLCREIEMVKLRNGNLLHSSIFGFPHNSRIHNEVKRFKVTQYSYDDFSVEIEANPAIKNIVESHFLNVANKYLGGGIKYNFRFVEAITREKSGKLNYFVCNFK